MFYVFFLFFFVLNLLAVEQDQNSAAHINTMVEHIYGKQGLNNPPDQVTNIQQLFFMLVNASNDELHQIAFEVMQNLKEQLEQVQNTIKEIDHRQERVPETLFYKKFLFAQQIEHLSSYLQYLPTNESVLERSAKTIKEWYSSVATTISSLFKAPQKHSLNTHAQQVLDYIAWEREHILLHYKKLLLFFELKKDKKFPVLIDFWDNPEVIEKTKKRAKKIAQTEVQSIGLILSMGLQALILAGGSLAIQWEDDADRIVYEQATKKQNEITSSWETFQQKLKKDQEDIITSIENAFTGSQKILSDAYNQNNALLQQEIVYMNKSINLAQPITRALAAPIIYDQYFAHAAMLTPSDGYPWYNIYQVASGDWEFDALHNSFYQYGLAPFPLPPLWQKKQDPNASLFTDDPAANSIFTEYATGQLRYTIEVECTLINVTYPFFMGVLCNRAHWISGDPERIWQYRLCGLYGIEEKTQGGSSHTIDFAFAQQKLSSSTKEHTEEIVSPLEQIMNDKDTRLFTLPAQEAITLKKNPVTYIIKITTGANTVECSLSKKEENKDGTQTTVALFNKTMENLDPYVFISAGIGFMASGCQASFTIKQPTQLQYTQKQINSFTQHLISMQKTTS